MNLRLVGDTITDNIKRSVFFPMATGNLKYNATSGRLIEPNVYRIKFDSSIAPYIDFLEFGTQPHNIPGAFGKPLPFGTSGKFSGFFHPGSTKHKGFISDKAVNEVINYFIVNYQGVIK